MAQAGKKLTADTLPTNDQELRAHIDRCIVEALDAYAVSETLTRSQAVGAILADWLRTHGYKITTKLRPSGPATDAVDAMETAIRKDVEAKRQRTR